MGATLLLLLSFLAFVPPAPQDATFIVEAVTVSGAKRFSTDQVAQLSAVATGSTIRLTDLDAAAKRLAATGLFNNVAYKYATSNGRISATFDIVEAEWTMPVGFDNFIWLTDEELLSDVRKKVPTFDGTSPNNGEAITYITGVLQEILKARGLPGTVEHLPFLNTRTKAQMHLYKVTKPSPTICAIQVTGTSAKWERDLETITKPMTGAEYSRAYLTGMSGGTLLDLLRSQGHWAAEVAAPQTSLSGGCSGVSVAIAVNEGPVFVWDDTDWKGNGALPANELAKLAGLRPGDVADGRNLEAGLRRVRDAYGKIGHVTAAVTYQPTLQADAKRVRVALEVTEGPQFRMGAIEIAGVPPADAANLQKRWTLKAGDVFDASYPAKFVTDDVRPVMRRLNLRTVVPELRPDTSRQIVNVRVVIRP